MAKDRAAERSALTQATLARLALFAPEYLCGFDEVGRGPLAGPVVAGAVVLDPTRPIAGLNDSKALRPETREKLSADIYENALAWGLGWVWPDDIEKMNIHNASLEAMRRAAQDLAARYPEAWSSVRIAVSDGKFCPDVSGIGAAPVERHALVKGDALCAAISAASIIAKVARDTWMCDYAKQDGRYGFERHMGYPTPAHWAALEKHGPCAIHRLSWVSKRFSSEPAQPDLL